MRNCDVALSNATGDEDAEIWSSVIPGICSGQVYAGMRLLGSVDIHFSMLGGFRVNVVVAVVVNGDLDDALK